MDNRTHCPDPELLSAYLDAGLDPASREAVASHLAECAQCRQLVAEVVRIQDAVPGARPELVAAAPAASTGGLRRLLALGWPVWPAGSLLALALLLGVAFWLTRTAPEGDHARLANASGAERTVEARLSGPFPYAPLRAPVRTSGGETAVSRPWTLVAAAGRIRDAHHADLSAASQHATGVAALLVGDYHEAIRALTAAADVAPADAGILADLAAAYHERARLGGRADDLPRALSAAERAIAADPARAEAWFNRALAISAIAPRDLAREAWQEYLTRESDPAWREEARQRIDDLTPSGDPWPVVLARLESTPTQSNVNAAVRQHTSRAREFLEQTLFPAWANAVLDDGDAQTPLGKARMLADAFSRLTGDQLARDVVIAIDRAEAAGTRRALAEATSDYARLSPAASISPGRSPTELANAGDRLRRQNCPLYLHVEIALASADYYRGRYDDVRLRLARIDLAARRAGYSDVLAQTTWLAGMTSFAQGELGDAQYLYEATLEVASSMGDTERMAGASLLLANLLEYVGDEPNAWRFRTETAALSTSSDAVRTKHGMLVSAAANSLSSGNPEASLLLQTAALETAAMIGWAVEAESLAQRARTLHALGRSSEGAADIISARELTSRVEDPVVQRRAETTILTVEAETLRTIEPGAAAAAATEALARLTARPDRLGVAQLAMTLAGALLQAGDTAGAERAVLSGIAAFDDERQSLSSEGRISYSERSWRLFEQAILLARARGDEDGAFSYSERGRARTIVETRQWGSKEGHRLAEVQGALPTGTAMLVLSQFETELATWLVTKSSVLSANVPISRARAQTLVAAYAGGITTGSGGTHASGELFDALVRPHLAAIRDTKLLVIVPDSPYSSVAFAGLMDRRRSRFLIEDVALTVSPSATVFVRAMARAKSRSAEPLSALILGAPASSFGSRMAVLPAARNEAGEIAALYASAELRAGASATPARLLDDGPRRDVVHVAAHGMTNAEYPLLSRLMLADLPGRPHSGAVFASEVAARDFSRTSLVVLAACDSGGGPEARGEGALSLARAFLAAGVPTVVSALGPLDDNLARQMFVEFHRAYQRGASAAESLQQVQVQALQRTGRQPGPWARLAVFGASQPTLQDRHRGRLP